MSITCAINVASRTSPDAAATLDAATSCCLVIKVKILRRTLLGTVLSAADVEKSCTAKA